ncbi:TetR/AcrR family transcriptional regulator [Streptomyces sp. HUAS MG47]|uniref:TetR/AcrR family transcriptional regulator n=1 Tax=Streptomyces solicamelliae TaxID=3231716 RepID=UPI003878295F
MTTDKPDAARPGKTPDASRRSERSRRAIFDAALALVSETGYAKTTVEGIAARAGVGKQTIYRWWPSKAAVLLDAFLDLAAQANEALGRDVGDGEGDAGIPDTGDLAADLRYVLRATVDELNDPKYDGPTRALAAEGLVSPDFGAQMTELLMEPQLAHYVRRLEAAREDGDIAPDADVRIAAELLTAPLAQRWQYRDRPLTHAYADAVLTHVLRGLSPRP